MPISPTAVKDFLARPRRDSSTIKSFTEAQLRAKLAALDPPMETSVPPRIAQIASLLLCLKYTRYGVFLDPGVGKTFVMLTLFRYRKKLGLAKRMLVAVPNTVNVPGWIDQVAEHGMGLTAGGANDEETLAGKPDVVIVTYATLLRMCCVKEPSKKHAGNRLVIDLKRIRAIASEFDTLVPDESAILRNKSSTTFRTIRQLAKLTKYFYPLTGTPFGGQDPEDLWGQFNLIDGGWTYGETIGLFRGAFSKEVKGDRFPEYKFDKSKVPLVRRFARHCSIRYEVSECLDLPPITRVRREVVFDQETWAYYDGLVEELRQARGNFRLVDNAFHRLRQLTSGYLGYKDSEDAKHNIMFKQKPKLELMMSDVVEAPADRKQIIFHVYVTSGDLICDALKALKIKHLRLQGATKNKDEVLRRMTSDETVPILVCSVAAGSKGLNLQVANYIRFFETPTAPIDRRQAEARVWRQGQTRRTFIYDYLVKNSIDMRIAKALKEGRDLQREIIDGSQAI